MFCDEMLDLIEPIAAGDVALDDRLAAHVAGCSRCASALEDARQVEALLKTRPAPAAPAKFTSRTLARVRRDRWRREQIFDAAFNLAMGAAGFAVAAGILLVVYRAGVISLGTDASDLIGATVGALTDRLAAAFPLYASATALLAAALGIWWWAERETTQ